MNKTITVPVKLDVKRVNMLVTFLNSTDEEDMRIFIEEILKETDRTSLSMRELSKSIMQENPFSQKHLK